MKTSANLRGILTLIQFVITVLMTIVFMYLFRFNTQPVRRTWAKLQTFLMNFKIDISNEPSHEASLVLLNHQSVVDIVAFEAIYPKNLCWVAKKEIQDIPLFGHVVNAPRMIAIDRSDKRSLIKMLKIAKERLEEGRVIAMFPEGTRGDGHSLLPFQSGAKVLAEKLGLRVQPALILNANRVFDSKTLRAHGGESVQVIYLEPINPKENANWYEKMQMDMKERLRIELANTSSHR